LQGIKPPYLLKINEYPLISPLFLGTKNEQEGRKKKRRGGRRRKGDEPSLHLALGLATEILESKRSVTSRWSDYFYRHLEPILKGNHIR
jgi:hypothetical protein